MPSTAISSQLATFSIAGTAGGAKTITAAAPGNPTIFTSAAHGLTNGDVVVLGAIVGTMSALNGSTQVLRRASPNTFSVDADTTGLVYTSGGTATPNAWTPIANIKTFAAFDGAAANIDTTNLMSTGKEFLMGLPDFGQFTLALDLDQSDPGQLSLLAHQASQAMAAFKLVLPNSRTATFNGFVKKAGADGGVDKVMTRAVDILVSGAPTWA